MNGRSSKQNYSLSLLESSKEKQENKKWVRRLNIWTEKLHALFWIVLAGFIIYKTNFFRVIWEHPMRNMFFLDIGIVLFTTYMIAIWYLTLYLPIVRGIHDWEEKYPNIIPFLSLVGVGVFVSSFLAFFPIWGFLTIPIIVVIFMGYSMWMAFLPGGYLGAFCALLLLFLMSATSHFIPHESNYES